MNKILRLLVILALIWCSLPLLARDFEYTYEGQTLTYTVIDEEAKTVMTKAGGEFPPGNNVSGELIIPAIVFRGDIEYSVTSIGNYAFGDCSGLTSVTIANSVTSIGEGAFFQCSGLTSLTIPDSVTSIGESAFAGCSGLTLVTLSNSLTSIAWGTFSYCTGLTSITIPDSVTSIEYMAFYDCTQLQSVYIGKSVTYISDAFSKPYGMLTLSKVEFASVESLCNISFDGLNSNPIWGAKQVYIAGEEVKDLVIPDTVTEIHDGLFKGYAGLTSVTVGNSVTSIGDSAFNGCTGLTSVTIGSSVTSIGDNAFLGCGNLTSVNIPRSVNSIGEQAFYNCSMPSVVVPGSVNSIGENAFGGNNALSDIYGEYVDLSVIFEEGITTVNPKWFAQVKSVTLPNSVHTITELPYWGAWTRYLTLGTGIKNIGSRALAGVNTIYISALNPPALDDNVFANTSPVSIMAVVPHDVAWAYKKDPMWSKMTIMDPVAGSITVELDGSESLTVAAYNQTGMLPVNIYKLKIVGPVASDDWNQFQNNMINCVELDLTDAESEVFPKIIPHRHLAIPYFPKGVKILEAGTTPTVKEIPETVVRIENGIFRWAEFEGPVKTGPDLTYIGSESFIGSNLSAIDMSASTSLKEIGEQAFALNKELTQVILPSSVTKISDRAFYGSSLSDITLPESMEMIGKYAFSSTELTEIVLPHAEADADEIVLGESAFSQSPLTRVVLNSDVRRLPDDCFSSTKISEIEIPESVTDLGVGCFSWCRELENIIIPGSVRNIGNGCFSGCTNLNSLTLEDGVESIGEYAFVSTKLNYIEFPTSLTSIGRNAFQDVPFTWISCLGTVPPVIDGELKYEMNYQQCVLSVPGSAFFDYLQAPVWGRFGVLDGRVDIESDKGSIIECAVEESNENPADAPRRVSGEQNMVRVYNGQAVMVTKGSVLRFHISITEGDELVGVTYNGKDVTNEVVNGFFTTPYISGSTVLKVETTYVEPEVPEVLEATEMTDAGFTANWQACENAEGYLISIESSADGKDYKPVQGWSDRKCGDTLTVAFADAIAGISYYRYAVKAVYANSKVSELSEWMNVKIDDAGVDVISTDFDGKTEIFTLQGVRVNDAHDLAPGIYIVRRGDVSRKIVVK